MTTVGAATHSHTVGGNVGGCTYTISAYGDWYDVMANHSHTISSFASGVGNNAPVGYGLDIIYMSLAAWEASVRCFPAGAVVVSANILATDSKFARFSSADGKFIYHAAPGTSTGSVSHSHSVSGYTKYNSSSVETDDLYPGQDDAADPANHRHTVSGTSASSSPEPAYVQTRFYEALQETDNALKNVVVFLDGAPSSNWEALSSWNGKSLKAGDCDVAFGGSDSHTHANGSVAVAVVYSSPTWICHYTSVSYSTYWDHTHTVTVSLQSASNIPPSIQLTPYKLLNTISKINTRTVGYSQDLLIKRTQPSQAAFDLMSKKNDIGKTSTYNLRLRDSYDLYTLSDMLSKMELSKTFESDLMFVSRGISVYQSGIKLNLLGTHYQNTIRLITRDHGDTWVLGAWLYAIVRQMDKIQQRAELAYLIHDVNYATEEDLDEFGSKYDLARRSGESDWDYRKRIKMFTSQLTGSGTRDVLESIINSITEVDGSANVVTYPPAHVGITFSSTDAIIAALEHKDLIELSLENALAAGVGYTLYLPIIRYLMSYSSVGPEDFEYPCTISSQRNDIEFDYYGSPLMVGRIDVEHDCDIRAMISFDWGYSGNIATKTVMDISRMLKIVSRKAMDAYFDGDILEKAMGVHYQYDDGMRLKKFNINVYYRDDVLISGTRKSVYLGRVSLEQRGESELGSDILTRNLHLVTCRMLYSQSKAFTSSCECGMRVIS